MTGVNTFAVLAKNLSNRNGERCEASALVNLNDKFEYWPFEPKHKDDFKKLKEYGMVKGDKMVRHYILHMSDSRAALDLELAQLRQSGRLPNPKRRYSSTPTEHPFKLYKLVSERKEIKNLKMSKNAASSKAKSSNFHDILAQNQRQIKENKKHGMKTNMKKISSKEQEEGNQASQAASSECSTTETEKETEGCSHCKELTKQLELACSESESWRVKYDDLLQRHDNIVKQHEALKAEKARDIESIKVSVEKLPGIIKDLKDSSSDCYLKNLHLAVKLENDFQNFEVDEGEVYIGNGKTISHESLYEVGEITTQSQRVHQLAQLFWPDEMHLRSLSGKSKYKDLKMIKITDREKKAIKTILNQLPGEEKVDLKGVNKLLKNVTNLERSKRFGSAGIVRKAAQKRKKQVSSRKQKSKDEEEDFSGEDDSESCDEELEDKSDFPSVKKAKVLQGEKEERNSEVAFKRPVLKGTPLEGQGMSEGSQNEGSDNRHSEDLFSEVGNGVSQTLDHDHFIKTSSNKNGTRNNCQSEDLFSEDVNTVNQVDLDQSFEISPIKTGTGNHSDSETDYESS